MEFLTATGLSSAAGLNAYIPMLALGLLDRFTNFVNLPPAWSWLSNDWMLWILGVLLVVEVVADKIPVVDSINDVLQTVVRPAAGGVVFASGVGSETVTVSDPGTFFASDQWIPVVIGVVIALAVHLFKMGTRPVLNTATVGTAAPVVSAVEDGAAVGLAAAAIFLPILVLVLLAALAFGFYWLFTKIRRRSEPETGIL
ncbi:DUF4126 domain-containing protein [Neomicrococcus lactis]|uniref:Uncharacterized membrane protein (UPF0136 family) n=1 Tax=Neomicrococcus lactis TaxID=732241 RepID=A0A7W8YBV3_9MICC|nr:DUF4126 domain-containing protein [Neomicrococcus lactis]MBB5598527.1 uncharacterized membrane protein (UPF0136 family) [Neomicrococcus lactis]